MIPPPGGIKFALYLIHTAMKKIMIVGIALLAGGSLFAQTGASRPEIRSFTCVNDRMSPDNVTARPWPIHYQGTPYVPKELRTAPDTRVWLILPSKPNRPMARRIDEKMKPN